MSGYDPSHASSSPDSATNTSNVSTLRPLFTVPAQSDQLVPRQSQPPIENNGFVYAGATNAGDASGELEVFNDGARDSQVARPVHPVVDRSDRSDRCRPGRGKLASRGQQYHLSRVDGVRDLGDSAHVVRLRCEWGDELLGVPKVCQPLWTAPLTAGDIHVESPNVSNGVVYVSGYQSPGPPPSGPTGTF